MLVNRCSPDATVIPVLGYENVVQASEWLCAAFGFRERLRIGTHRVQLVFGEGAVIVTERPAGYTESPAPSHFIHSIHVRVEDADAHYERAKRHGARIINPPTDYAYGERQYVVVDIGGHQWTFSQSIADVDPASLGFEMPEPDAV